MKTKLFLSECKRALPPVLVVFILLTILAIGVQRYVMISQPAAKGVKEGVDILLAIVLVGSGFMFGSRPFSREFKENHSPLLLTLPLRRISVWLIIVSANLLVCVAALAIPAVFRPGLLAPDANAIGCLFVFVILFASACCFSLLFSRAYLNYVIGYLVTGFLLWMIFLYGNITVFGIDISKGAVLSETPAVIGGAFSLLILFFLCSAYFYVQGEFALIKSRLRNGLCLFCGAAAILMFLELSPGPRLFGFGEWTLDLQGMANVQVTSHGDKLSVVETSSRYPLYKRINVLDTKSGKIINRCVVGGAAQVVTSIDWSIDGRILNILTYDYSPLRRLGFLPAASSLLRFSADGKVLGRTRISRSLIEELTPLPNRNVIFVENTYEQGTVSSIDEETGALHRLKSAPLEGYPYVWPLRNGASLVGFPAKVGPKIWMFDAQMREVQWNWSDLDKANRKIVASHPFTKKESSGKIGKHLLPFEPENEEPFILYLLADPVSKTCDLYVFSPKQQQWDLLIESLPLQKDDLTGLSRHELMWPESLFRLSGRITIMNVDMPKFHILMDDRNGLIVYRLQVGNQNTLNLYDAALEKKFFVCNIPADLKAGTFSARAIGRTLKFSLPQTGFFLYRGGSGHIRTESERVCSFFISLDAQDNPICASFAPRLLFILKPDGTRRQLWPVATN